MRHLVLVLALSGCANSYYQFADNLETLEGVKESQIVETLGTPAHTIQMDDGVKYTLYNFTADDVQTSSCAVTFKLEGDTVVDSRWHGTCGWDAEGDTPYARAVAYFRGFGNMAGHYGGLNQGTSQALDHNNNGTRYGSGMYGKPMSTKND